MRKNVDRSGRYPVIDMLSTGRNIARLRRAAGLSVKDLQGYFGFTSPQAIYKWQAGQALPTLDNLLALARRLGVSIEEILVCRETTAEKGGERHGPDESTTEKSALDA